MSNKCRYSRNQLSHKLDEILEGLDKSKPPSVYETEEIALKEILRQKREEEILKG
jgi:hypothetical protein